MTDCRDYVDAHRLSANHRSALQKDSLCGCFYCLRIFSPENIQDWIKDMNGTALCPFCGVDAVLGESAGYPITAAFLAQYWFRHEAAVVNGTNGADIAPQEKCI